MLISTQNADFTSKEAEYQICDQFLKFLSYAKMQKLEEYA